MLRFWAKQENLKQNSIQLLRNFKLPKDFPPEVKTIAKKLKIDISEKELSRRHDIRDMEIITIDPADARDFDDALSLEILPNGDNYLGVAY